MCGWPVFKCTNHVSSLGYGAEKSGDFLSFSCSSWVKLIGQKPYVHRGRAITRMGVVSLDNDATALSRNDVSWTTNLVLVMTKALHCPARTRVLKIASRACRRFASWLLVQICDVARLSGVSTTPSSQRNTVHLPTPQRSLPRVPRQSSVSIPTWDYGPSESVSTSCMVNPSGHPRRELWPYTRIHTCLTAPTGGEATGRLLLVASP